MRDLSHATWVNSRRRYTPRELTHASTVWNVQFGLKWWATHFFHTDSVCADLAAIYGFYDISFDRNSLVDLFPINFKTLLQEYHFFSWLWLISLYYYTILINYLSHRDLMCSLGNLLPGVHAQKPLSIIY